MTRFLALTPRLTRREGLADRVLLLRDFRDVAVGRDSDDRDLVVVFDRTLELELDVRRMRCSPLDPDILANSDGGMNPLVLNALSFLTFGFR